MHQIWAGDDANGPPRNLLLANSVMYLWNAFGNQIFACLLVTKQYLIIIFRYVFCAKITYLARNSQKASSLSRGGRGQQLSSELRKIIQRK